MTAERLLPDSQCGFRRGQRCVDMIFVVRQLLEKTGECGDFLFMMFIDLRMAYDFVPRGALWDVLLKCGVPPTMLSIILFMREWFWGNRFEVRNGL